MRGGRGGVRGSGDWKVWGRREGWEGKGECEVEGRRRGEQVRVGVSVSEGRDMRRCEGSEGDKVARGCEDGVCACVCACVRVSARESEYVYMS